MVLILEIAVASIAVALILSSLKTLQAIKHIGVGKSFWMPVAVAGFLFFFGSIVAVLFELNFSLTAYTDEVVQISRVLALSILAGGVYSYSRKVTNNLGKEVTIPNPDVKTNDTVEEHHPIAQAPEIVASPIQDTTKLERPRKEGEAICRNQLGYLRTLPIDALIPDECLSCDRIIECKHSPPDAVEIKQLKSQ